MGQLVTFWPAERDFARVRVDHAAGHAERGRLAGAVRSQQADDLARIDFEIDAIDDAPPAIRLHQPANF